MNNILKFLIIAFSVNLLGCNLEKVSSTTPEIGENKYIDLELKYKDYNINGKNYYIIAKGGLWAREKPSLLANKKLLIPEGYPIGTLSEIKREPVTIDGITDYWVAVDMRHNDLWLFGGYLSTSPKPREIKGIPLDEDYCLRYTNKTFPDKFESGCWGWECLFRSGAVNYSEFMYDNVSFIFLNKDNTGVIQVTDNRDDTTFKNIVWKKEKDSILVSGLYKHRTPNFYQDNEEKKWKNEQLNIYGKVNFFIDFTLKISMNNKNKFEYFFHALDKNPINGKKIAEYYKLDNEHEFVGGDNCVSPFLLKQ